MSLKMNILMFSAMALVFSSYLGIFNLGIEQGKKEAALSNLKDDQGTIWLTAQDRCVLHDNTGNIIGAIIKMSPFQQQYTVPGGLVKCINKQGNPTWPDKAVGICPFLGEKPNCPSSKGQWPEVAK